MSKNDRLKEIVMIAVENVPYYRQLIQNLNVDITHLNGEEVLELLPILEKKDLLIGKDRFLNEQYDKEKISWGDTSGSTGTILNVAWDKNDLFKALFPLWKSRKKYGIYSNSKKCVFHIGFFRRFTEEIKNYYSPKKAVLDNGTTLSFNKLYFDDETLMFYYREMEQFSPEWVLGAPSTIYLLTAFLKKQNLPKIKSIKYIELTGEIMQDQYRKAISNYFEVPIVNQYGTTETQCVAYECEEGNMHILESNVYVDVYPTSDNIGGLGNICLTSLTNRLMPFIKYNSGDRGLINHVTKCKCGNHSPILSVSVGRSTDLIIQRQNKSLDGAVFYYIIRYINGILDDCVKQFKVIQNDFDQFDVLLSLEDSDYFEDIIDIFTNQAVEFGMTNAIFSFKKIEQIIPSENSNKLCFFESHLNKV